MDGSCAASRLGNYDLAVLADRIWSEMSDEVSDPFRTGNTRPRNAIPFRWRASPLSSRSWTVQNWGPGSAMAWTRQSHDHEAIAVTHTTMSSSATFHSVRGSAVPCSSSAKVPRAYQKLHRHRRRTQNGDTHYHARVPARAYKHD